MQMIALAGLKPHEDIEIVFTGLRPGEKLYEELSHGGESVTSTPHPKVARLLSPPLPHAKVTGCLQELNQALEEGADADGLKMVLAKMLPEYSPSNLLAPNLPSRVGIDTREALTAGTFDLT
jgi:FlaA1/EpsC-like NDP-sugar epimerase